MLITKQKKEQIKKMFPGKLIHFEEIKYKTGNPTFDKLDISTFDTSDITIPTEYIREELIDYINNNDVINEVIEYLYSEGIDINTHIKRAETLINTLTDETIDDILYACPHVESLYQNIIDDVFILNTVYNIPKSIVSMQDIIRCNLVPFYINDELYVSLAGAGMDLSPKLDALYALSFGWVPKSSYFTNPAYKEYITSMLGKKIYNEVLHKISTKQLVIIIS